MIAFDLNVGWQFDLVVFPLIIVAGLIVLRVRAARRERRLHQEWRRRNERRRVGL
jgi:hypothetical protein